PNPRAVMDCRFLPPLWQAGARHLAALLHARNAWRLDVLLLGALCAHGRRTVTRWLRAAGVGLGWAAYYYFLGVLGRRAHLVAALLLGHALRHLAPEGPLL